MLLKNLINSPAIGIKKIQIKGLAINSKEVKKDFIFFAIKGQKNNGEEFINEAVKRGASVIICAKNCKFKRKKIVVIKTKNIRHLLSEVASKFYKSKPKNIIAVTGTNGKTSVADLFYQILSLNKIPAASIGTLGVKYKNKIIKTDLTSPDTISIHKYLQLLKNNNIENVIIEASSHGLDQSRLNHINFKAAIFTNFSQDHLDYHKTMRSYLNAKLILLRKILLNNSSVILDKTIREFLILNKILKKRKLKLIEISKITNKIKNISESMKSEFQKKNLAMAIAATKLCGLKDKKIYKSLKRINNVNGRMELVRRFSNNIRVFVDYAHTPDALLKTLQSLKDYYGKNISLVFGCGGNRDEKKRPLMAKIANIHCKKIYVTDDNPRKENPKKIRIELVNNILAKKCFNIGNRSEAIKKAVLNAEPNEIVLVAGKGHESQQIYKNNSFSISDKQIVKKLKVKIQILSKKKQEYLNNIFILKKIIKNVKPFNFQGLTVDSRMVKKNNLFLAIKGKNNDGNKFIPDALNKGAKYIVSSKVTKKYKSKTIKVKSEISFLNKFAKLKRKYSLAKIIGITGSAGKTSLKNIIRDLLQNFEKTHSSPRSFNNHFGVPISLSNLNIDDKFGIFEVGMSKAGEINNLSKLIQPHIGIITNIGEAHIENFKNIKDIAKAKGEIIDNIKKNGTVILNKDDKFFNYLAKKARSKKIKIVSFGKNKKSDVCPIKFSNIKNLIKLTIKVKDQKLDLCIRI